MVLLDSKFTINIHIKIKKKMEKIINYHHKSTLYIPVKCTMQQSVDGNIKHKTCDNKREGDSASNKASTTVSTAIFLVCFGCTVRVGLGSSCCEFKKMLKCSYWLITRRQFSVRIRSSQLSVWQILQKRGRCRLLSDFLQKSLSKSLTFMQRIPAQQ